MEFVAAAEYRASSRPSGAGAGQAPAAQTAKKKRKRGGQKGHPQHARPLLDVEQCDEVVTLRPSLDRGQGSQSFGDIGHPLAPARAPPLRWSGEG